MMWLGAAQSRDKQAADEHAFTLLIDSHLPGAYRMAYGMLGSTANAEDAVQEAALRAWRSFGRFRKDAEIRPWLYTIVANECRSHLRRLRRRNDDGQIGDVASQPNFTDPGLTDLRRALDRLPTDQRLLIVLRYYLDLPLQDVALAMGCALGTAKSTLHAALTQMRLASPDDEGVPER